MGKLSNKVAVITGSSSGIGKEIALRFSQEGANVVVTSNTSVEKGQNVVKQIIKDGGNAIYIRADLTKYEEVQDLFRKVKEKFGIIDILVNNAGCAYTVDFNDFTPETIENDIKVNYYSAVYCSMEAVKLMPKEGHIINTSSIRGLECCGRKGLIGFSSAKAALISLTKNLANELAPNIFVNAVAPGFVATEFLLDTKEDLIRQWETQIPIGRFIKPEELTDVYLLLATSKIFTGSVIIPDGGYTLLEK